jgi:hypothetical protein
MKPAARLQQDPKQADPADHVIVPHAVFEAKRAHAVGSGRGAAEPRGVPSRATHPPQLDGRGDPPRSLPRPRRDARQNCTLLTVPQISAARVMRRVQSEGNAP